MNPLDTNSIVYLQTHNTAFNLNTHVNHNSELHFTLQGNLTDGTFTLNAWHYNTDQTTDKH